MILLYPIVLGTAVVIWGEGVAVILLAVPLVNPDAGNALLFAGLIVGLGAIAAYSAALAKRA